MARSLSGVGQGAGPRHHRERSEHVVAILRVAQSRKIIRIARRLRVWRSPGARDVEPAFTVQIAAPEPHELRLRIAPSDGHELAVVETDVAERQLFNLAQIDRLVREPAAPGAGAELGFDDLEFAAIAGSRRDDDREPHQKAAAVEAVLPKMAGVD